MQNEDLLLWQQLKEGNHKAYEKIYSSYVDDLISYGYKLCTDEALIEDAIHEIFVRIWNKRDSLSPTNSIIRYLCVAFRRELFAQIKFARTQVDYDDTNKDVFPSQNIEDHIVDLEDENATNAELVAAVNQLAVRQKEALHLRFFQEMAYEDICEVMGINYQSVRNLIHRGILELRKRLKE